MSASHIDSHLESPRLMLRPYQQSDFDAFVALNGNAEVRRHVGGPLTKAEAATRFESFISGESAPSDEAWAVTVRGTGAYIGHCWLVLRGGARDPELGFIIDPKGQRREPAADDVRFVSERIGWLPFAGPPGVRPAWARCKWGESPL